MNLTAIAKALGLPETATEADILAAVTRLQGENTDACNRAKDVCNRLQVAEAELVKNREAQADADLAPLQDRLSAEERTAVRDQLVANRAATLPLLRLVANAKPVEAPKPVEPAKPASILNRVPAKTPAAAPEVKSTRVAIGAAVDTIMNRDHCTRETAFARARSERPELFVTLSQ